MDLKEYVDICTPPAMVFAAVLLFFFIVRMAESRGDLGMKCNADATCNHDTLICSKNGDSYYCLPKKE